MSAWERKARLEHMFNERAPIARTFGMSLSYDDEGRAYIHLPYNPRLDHAGSDVHGGAVMTMLDNAGWFTCALFSESGLVLTSDFTAHLLEPASRADLVATGDIIRAGKLQNVARMLCRDREGRLVAHAVGTFVNISPGSKSSGPWAGTATPAPRAGHSAPSRRGAERVAREDAPSD